SETPGPPADGKVRAIRSGRAGSTRPPPASRARPAARGRSFRKRVFGPRIAPLAHLGRVQLHRLAYVLGERGVALHELGTEPVVQAEHVVQHEHLAVARGTRADTDRGDRE